MSPGQPDGQTSMSSAATARRMFELVEPIAAITFNADEPNEEMIALGLRDNYWDGYFAGRAGPLGPVSAEVADALFYNFGPGEAARHLPRVWSVCTPEQAHAARQRGSVRALDRILGDLVDSPGLVRAADLLTKAALGAPVEGRPMYAALRALPVPDEPVTRLWHFANALREHRGDGHVSALMSEDIDRTEAHVLLALAIPMPPAKFGRIHHLPPEYLAQVFARLRERGLMTDDDVFTDEGRATKQRIEDLTDRLAAPAYAHLPAADVAELEELLTPLAAALSAGQ